jgi:hypothetical protein
MIDSVRNSNFRERKIYRQGEATVGDGSDVTCYEKKFRLIMRMYELYFTTLQLLSICGEAHWAPLPCGRRLAVREEKIH